MHAGLCGQQAVGVIAGDGQGGAFESRFFARLIVDQLALESAALHPPHVHPQQHFGPVLRLGSARAWMNGDDGVLGVVGTAQHLLDFAGLHFLVEDVEALGELPFYGFTGLHPLGQHVEVVALAAQREHQVTILLHAAAALEDLLGLRLVLPEIGG